MKEYSPTEFIQAFTKFSCKFSYPKKLLLDEGSQLIEECTSIKLDIRNVKSRLSQNVKIDFETCAVGEEYARENRT